MIIGIDIDGVLRDFVGQLRKVYLSDFPRHGPDMKPVEQYDLAPSFPLGTGIYYYMYHDRCREIFENAPSFPEAIPWLDVLYDWANENGHEVWIVTSQPRGTEAYTATWLRIEGAKYHSLVFTKKKHALPLSIMLDDSIAVVRACVGAGIQGVLMRQPYNVNDSASCVESLMEFVEEMKRRYPHPAKEVKE